MEKYSKAAGDKIEKVMHQKKEGTLRTGIGKKVLPCGFIISPIGTCLRQAGLPNTSRTKAWLEFQLGYIGLK